MDTSRRSLLAGSAAGLGLLPFLLGGCSELMTPEQARARKVPLRSLSESEALTLERFADVLLPGAITSGVAHFVDHHVSVPAEDCLLMLRYLDVPPPYGDFYKAGLAALDTYAGTRFGEGFAGLDEDQATGVVGEIIKVQPEGWQGPPAPFFTFLVRSDAVDVVYGTREGLEKLDLPAMGHIEPEQEW
jgi:hypothetical protein